MAVANSKLLLNKHRNSSRSRNSNSLVQTRISLIVSGLLSELNGKCATNVASGENILQMSASIGEGYVVKNLEPGCVLHARSVTFVAGFSPVIEVNHVVTRIPGSFLEITNDSYVMQKIDEALAHFDKVDYGALLKGGGRKSVLLSLSRNLHITY